jgi:uncharacterized membrane protein YobD (UPF0266 family)
MMTLVHVFTHQIGKGNSEMFVPLISSMHPILLGSLTPLIILGTWGSAFTFLSCIAISANIFQIDPKDNRTFLKLIFSRIVGGFFLILIYRILRYLTQFPDESFILKQIGPIIFNFGSSTLDSIVIVGIIVPIFLILLRKTRISGKIRVISAILIPIAIISLALSEFFIPWGRNAAEFLDQKGFYFWEFWISKLVYGRFKIAHTFSFGILGALLGYYIIMEVSEKKFMWFCFIFFLLGLLTIGIASFVDWTFLLRFANEDVPIWVQFFNLGAQLALFSIFMKYLEFGKPERRSRSAKRTIWLRRFGIVSLTLYTIGKFPADGVFWMLERIMGPAVDLSGVDPVLAWNLAEIYLFMGFVVALWFLILFLWEKIQFVLSVEWILGAISWILRMKKTVSLYASKRIYGPTKPVSRKEQEKTPIISN